MITLLVLGVIGTILSIRFIWLVNCQTDELTECDLWTTVSEGPGKKFVIELGFEGGECNYACGLMRKCVCVQGKIVSVFGIFKRPWINWTLSISDVKDSIVATGAASYEAIQRYETQNGLGGQDIELVYLVEEEPLQSFSIVMVYIRDGRKSVIFKAVPAEDVYSLMTAFPGLLDRQIGLEENFDFIGQGGDVAWMNFNKEACGDFSESTVMIVMMVSSEQHH